MHYYQHHIGDFIRDTSRLTDQQCMAYMRLIWMYYESEQPLPDEIDVLAMRVGCTESDASLILRAFFKRDGDVWRHTRCDKEIAAYHQMHDAASKAGKASAAKRSLNKKQTGVEQALNERLSDVEQASNERAANGQLTNNHKPVTNSSVSKDTGDQSPASPAEVIFHYGVPLLTNAGTSEKQARSFLGSLRKSHGDDQVIERLRECYRAQPIQPLEWLAKALPPSKAQQTGVIAGAI